MMEAASQPMRRNSGAASRAVAAASAHAALTLTPSPSPLLSRHQNANSLPITLRKVDPRIFEEDVPANPEATSAIVELRKRLEELRPRVAPRDTLACLPRVALQLVTSFVADDDIRGCVCLSRVNRAFYAASLHLIRRVALVPDVVSIDQLSRPGAAASLALFLDRSGRGQHIESLTLVRPKSVYALPATVKGPELHAQDLARLVAQLPHLTFLDVRGIVLRNFAPWCDHFLADVAAACPKLRSLRIGAVYLTTWEAGWWAPLAALEEFAVGSRREDTLWSGAGASAAGVPIVLPEDFFTMLRTLPSAARVKVWAPLAPASFTALVMPTTPIPSLQHLSVNAAGNTDQRPLEDAVKEAEAKEAAPAKGGAKGGKAAAAKQQEAAEGPRPTLPALRSVVLCDVRDRPEFAVELMVRLMSIAPGVEHWNVTNSQRSAPGKAAPAAPTRGARAKAQS